MLCDTIVVAALLSRATPHTYADASVASSAAVADVAAVSENA